MKKLYGLTLVMILVSLILVLVVVVSATTPNPDQPTTPESIPSTTTAGGDNNNVDTTITTTTVETTRNEITSPLANVGGGWYSRWPVIDGAIRPSNRPTQAWYPSTIPLLNNGYGYPDLGNMTPWQRDQAMKIGMGTPMVTSIKTPTPLGVWSNIGTAYTTNPADSTVVYLYRKALDPGRDFYQYKIVTDRGFEIPLDTNITELRNGQTFHVPGWDAKGDFTANITSDGYSFVYV